ncbi:MAG: CopG family ribbon-helix-helix protein [Dermatophilaceae bacterium]
MRLHIEVDDDLVAEVDAIAGTRGRSGFVRAAIRDALAERRRWRAFDEAVGTVPSGGHEWDDDPARWVRSQRRADGRRAG